LRRALRAERRKGSLAILGAAEIDAKDGVGSAFARSASVLRRLRRRESVALIRAFCSFRRP
jgi:hypothetical protein